MQRELNYFISILVRMPYCAVYNCSSSSNVDKNLSFFGFPKDVGLQKAWRHYCRRKKFKLTKYSKICGKHFTPDQYSRYPPRLVEYPNARAQLKDDAVPDVEWPTDDKCSTSSNMQNKSPAFGAYKKRQRLEVRMFFFLLFDQSYISVIL